MHGTRPCLAAPFWTLNANSTEGGKIEIYLWIYQPLSILAFIHDFSSVYTRIIAF
jgi:hypothetical protein